MEKEDYKLSIWAISSIVIGLLFIVFIFTGRFSFSDVTGASTFDDIEVKAISYVEKEIGDGDINILNVFEKDGRYEVNLRINNEDYVYILEGNREFLRKA